ncbi:hypothetical protein VB735_32695 [Halotia wernerae UHCC 0503]|nr:hypothetical protein [Halotia wernerae UHCC 0503]
MNPIRSLVKVNPIRSLVADNLVKQIPWWSNFEQEKIANFLTTIDKKIEAVPKKSTTPNNLKKAYSKKCLCKIRNTINFATQELTPP